ncbi:peptidyl-prolyl cis-trans isomerase [Winogradskyella aurantiaca]|uniref:peptidyl-prolyl cis-trans isomerase n=1 Tax=Winogradskyella aurantiaca TaxID=2219558 RepID=UPI001E57274C|nr:peptidyl-prolyl cis-trans isomerase [Winogradskyella aurantiaca]
MRRGVYIILIGVVVSCGYFNKVEEEQVIARVKDKYLYMNEIEDLVPDGISKPDSILVVNSYINRWARQHLLMDGAQRNLTESQQSDFEALVIQYKNDLFTKAYLDGLVLKNIDTIITFKEAEEFYLANRESFKLNENIIKLRYINISLSALNLKEVAERLRTYDSTDRVFLDSIKLQFNSYALNDSVWVDENEVLKKIPIIDVNTKDEVLKISNFMQLKDSINLYLIKVVDKKRLYDYAPLSYVLPTIQQLVLNKRKLELTKELENDIIKDAIKTNEFEIYE